jgi:acyl-CoA synthetase (AMP-forming)/AMP-acid ligase II
VSERGKDDRGKDDRAGTNMTDDGYRTYLDVFEAVARRGDGAGLTFLDNDSKERFIGWTSLMAEVRSRGRKLAALGLRKGDRAALIIPDAFDFVLTFLGAVAMGIVPVPLYPPLALARLDAYLETTARILAAASADLVITTSQVEKVLWSVIPKVPSVRDLVTVEKLLAQKEPAEPAPQVGPSDPVFLQFTSGSTAAPKGVIVTHQSLLANARAIMHDGLRSDPDQGDKGISWLPLYHDMGLIGFVLSPLLNGVPIVYIPTLAFVRRPTLWLDVVSRHRATLTFAPNFAFARVTKRATEADLGRWDLSCLRVVGCGAEPIHPGTMRAFVDKFARCGLRPQTLLPCYGMAEATLAMTFVGLDDEMRVDTIDADLCHRERRAQPTRKNGSPAEPLELVSCGRPFPGHEIAVFDQEGRRVPERCIGEIRFRGPSVAGGYFRNPDATRESFGADGWLRTGDLGYLADGEVFISGRQKDILIVHGRNYYPQSIEWQVEDVPGIRKGNVVAFSVPGADTEEVVVVAETGETDPEKRVEVARQVKAHLNRALSLAPGDVVLLGVGELPKTTSGKLQRRKTREQYLLRTLGKDGVRTMGSTGQRLILARHFVVSLASRVRHRASRFWRRSPERDNG